MAQQHSCRAVCKIPQQSLHYHLPVDEGRINFPTNLNCDAQIVGEMGPRASMFNMTLQWRHNERDGVSNHRRLDCLLIHLFRRRSKKTSKLRVTGLCEGNSPVTCEFPPVTRKCFHLMTSSWNTCLLVCFQLQFPSSVSSWLCSYQLWYWYSWSYIWEERKAHKVSAYELNCVFEEMFDIQ